MTRPKKDAEELDASQKLKEEGYSGGSFIIECFYFHFDGTRFGPVNATFQIRKFEGERGVKSLPIVPLVCYANAGNIRKKLEERGDKFAKLSNPKATAHRKYKGLTLDKNQEQVRNPQISAILSLTQAITFRSIPRSSSTSSLPSFRILKTSQYWDLKAVW